MGAGTVSSPSGRNAVNGFWHHERAVSVLEDVVPQVAHFFAGDGDSWFHAHNGVVELLNLLEDRGFALVSDSSAAFVRAQRRAGR